MKKLIGYAVALGIISLPVVALAADFRVSDQPSLNTNEHVTNDVYFVGGTVTSAGSVIGDIVAGGGNVVISGTVSQDVIVGGGNITILSDIGDDIRAAGGNLVFQGKVGGDVVAAGGQITIGGSGVGGDVALAGGNIRIDAPVAGSMRIKGGNVYLNAPVAGNIQIEANMLTLGSRAVISGDLSYVADKELTKEEGAVVRGQMHFEQRPQRQISTAWIAGLISVLFLGKFLAQLVCAFLIGLVFRRYGRMLVTKAVEHPLLELGRGLLVVAALPVISVLLMITLIGIPFGILGFIGFFAACLFSWIVAPIIIGSVIYHYFSKLEWEVSWKSILIGVAVYNLLGLIPFIGWLAQALIMLITLGAVVSIKWSIAREWR